MNRFDHEDEDRGGRSKPKLAGVGSTIGDLFGVDPTLVRIGFVAVALILSWKLAIAAYVGAGFYLRVQEKKIRRQRGLDGGERAHRRSLRSERRSERRSEYDRMGDLLGEGRRPRASIKALREELDGTDRRLMAIDHHLSTQNDELAREIDALREEK